MKVFLREWRDHFGYTQERVAERIGTTKGTVSRMEVTQREPNLGYLAAFAEALDIEVADLFHDPAQPTASELLRDATPQELRQALDFIHQVKRTGTHS